VTTISERLGEFARDLDIEAVPPPVLALLKTHVLDTLGVMLAGSSQPDATPFVNLAAKAGGTPASTIVGRNLRVPARLAAFANGSLGRLDDFDDVLVGGFSHPTAIVLAAVIAVAERERLSGRRVLEALLVGVEVNCRLGLAVGPAFVARGIPAFSTLGVVAAAAGVGRLLGLSVGQFASAMGIAGSTACGSHEWLSAGGSANLTSAGWAAANAVLSADLARRGFDGSHAIIESPKGLVHAFGRGDLDLDRITDGLGSRWDTTELALKAYPTCQGAQAYVHSALQLVRVDGIEHTDITQIRVTVGTGVTRTLCEPIKAKRRPASAHAAKFSIPFLVAVALHDGELTLEQVAAQRLEDPAVQALADRVDHVVEPLFEAKGPVRGLVEVTLRDGRTVKVDTPASPGTADFPLSESSVLDKFRRNALRAIPEDHDQAIVQAVSDLEHLSDIEKLTNETRKVRASNLSEAIR
jgi:2-methylcitrate dehydratase PrpD